MNEWISKTKRKQQMHQLQELGIRIAACDMQVWDELGLDEATRKAMSEYATLSREAKRRQAQYIGKLLRNYPAETLFDYFTKNEQLQRYRDRLAAKLPDWYRALLADSITIPELAQQLPQLDEARLTAALAAVQQLDKHQHEKLAIPPKDKVHGRLWQVLRDALPASSSG